MLNPRKASIIGFAALVGAMLILFQARQLFATSPVLIAAQIAAALLMVWARLTFGSRSFHPGANPTEGALITTGPYAFIRHPIYAAILLFIAAAVACHPSWRSFGALLLAIAGAMIRMFSEEKLLRETYPQYATYSARTKRIVPFVF